MTDLAALLEEIGLDFWVSEPHETLGGFIEMEFDWQAYAARLTERGVRVTGDAGLDVERLARALRRLDFNAWGSQADMPDDFARAAAAAIAREYAALATGDEP